MKSLITDAILKDNFLRSSKNNADINEKMRDEWIQDCLLYFNENPTEYIYYTTSGNAIVIGHKEDGVIQIWDAKLIRQATLPWENPVENENETIS